jgi:hypothetical protein
MYFTYTIRTEEVPAGAVEFRAMANIPRGFGGGF